MSDDNLFFHFRLSWIFLLKHVWFCVSKILWKKFEIFLFFSLLQINIFNVFVFFLIFFYIYSDWIWLRSHTLEEYIKLGFARQDSFELVLPPEGPKIAMGSATVRPISLGSCYEQDPSIMFFSFLSCNFFPYSKEEINWYNFFILFKSWVIIIFFHLRLCWISLLRHIYFYISKIIWKKLKNFNFFL